MRRAEIVDLTWEQIDLNGNTVLVNGKGKKERLLPLHPMVIPVMKEYQSSLPEDKRHRTEPVFWSRLKKKSTTLFLILTENHIEGLLL